MVGLDYLAWGIVYFFLMWFLPISWINNEISYLEAVGTAHVAVVMVIVGLILLIPIMWATTHLIM